MPHRSPRLIGALALSLSLCVAVGCSSPVVPQASVPETAAGPDSPTSAAEAPKAAPDPALAPVARVAPVTFEGIGSYNGEPLVGYTVSVRHLHTDEDLGATANADGLSIVSQTPTTDASGRYRVEVAGLQPGLDVRVALTSPTGVATLFATLTAPDAEAPEATTDQGAIDEATTLSSVLTEGPSLILWEAVTAPEAAQEFRVMQTSRNIWKKMAKLKQASRDHALALRGQTLKPAFEKDPGLRRQMLMITAQREALREQAAKDRAERQAAARQAMEREAAARQAAAEAARQAAKDAAAEAAKQEAARRNAAFEAAKQEAARRAAALEASRQQMRLAAMNSFNRVVKMAVQQAGVEKTLQKATLSFVKDLASLPTPSVRRPIQPIKIRPIMPIRLLGTNLEVPFSTPGLPTAIVNSSTQKEISLEAIATGGGQALTESFMAPATTSGGSTTPAPAPAPVLSSLSVSQGAVGATVTLTGTGFSATPAENAVSFNGTAATVSAATNTSLTVTVPAGATSGGVTVTVAGQTSAPQVFYRTDLASTTLTMPASSNYGGAGAGLAVGPGTDKLYVVRNNATPRSVARYDTATGTEEAVIAPRDATGAPVLAQASAIAFDSLGRLYIADGCGYLADHGWVPGNKVVRVDLTTNTHEIVVASVNNPSGLAFDSAGNLYVASFTDNAVYKYTADGTLIGEVASGFDGKPYGLAIDASNNVYVAANATAGTHGKSIYKVSPTGTKEIFYRNENLWDPHSLAVDSNGHLWATFYNMSTLLRIAPDRTATTVAGPWAPNGLNGMAIDSKGTVFMYNNTPIVHKVPGAAPPSK